jgi:hypothetical protein
LKEIFFCIEHDGGGGGFLVVMIIIVIGLLFLHSLDSPPGLVNYHLQ